MSILAPTEFFPDRQTIIFNNIGELSVNIDNSTLTYNNITNKVEVNVDNNTLYISNGKLAVDPGALGILGAVTASNQGITILDNVITLKLQNYMNTDGGNLGLNTITWTNSNVLRPWGQYNIGGDLNIQHQLSCSEELLVLGTGLSQIGNGNSGDLSVRGSTLSRFGYKTNDPDTFNVVAGITGSIGWTGIDNVPHAIYVTNGIVTGLS